MSSMSIKNPKPRANAHLYFPSYAKVKLKGFHNAEINERVKIIIEGTVSSVSSDVYEDGEGEKRMRVDCKSCTIYKSSDNGAVSITSDED